MAVTQTPTEAIVRFLSFSNISSDYAPALKTFSARHWERVQLWLDDSGMAFYFLQKLNETNFTAIVPRSVLSRLKRNFASNQVRIDSMACRFNEINQRFNAAGVRYEVVKGFSLVPEFCPSASLRYQADFDYLVPSESLPTAQRVLTDAGYIPKKSRSSKEFIFVSPGGKAVRGDAQYSPRAAHAVELHTDIWDSEMHGLQPVPKLFSADQAKMHLWNGFSFPAQTEEDAFLLQVLHACRHLFTQWIRVSNLFEIAYFLNRRCSDTDFWNRVENRAGENAIVREFTVIAAELASRLFATRLPSVVLDWRAGIRRQSRVWLEYYARDWALCALPAYEFSLAPRTKLVLFLQQQYRSSRVEVEPTTQDRSPTSRFSRIALSLRRKPSLLEKLERRKDNRLVRRSVFYLLAQVRYLCEIPRWYWRTRASVSSRDGSHLQASETGH